MNDLATGNAMAAANIHNLTSLWRRMGSVPATRIGTTALNRSLSWPHRAWLESDRGWQPTARLREQLELLRPATVFPVWDYQRDDPGRWQRLLVAAGLQLHSVLSAMYLRLSDPALYCDNLLEVTAVTGSRATQQWAALCSRCFGYQVDSAVIDAIAALDEVRVLQGSLDGVPVATALVYRTGLVTGIHQVGVDPACRGRGLARALMKSVIDWTVNQWQPDTLVLQASREGLGLYRQLGFTEHFHIGLYTG